VEVAQLEPAAVVADVLARQHLRDDTHSADVAATARDLVGLHATGAPNPYLQLFARINGFERSMLDRALYERRILARVRCMRGTLFVLPLDLLPIAWAATRSLVLGKSTRYLQSQGLTLTSYEKWARRVETLLAGRALSAAQVRSELGVGPHVRLPVVLNQMCDEGRLLRDQPVAGWRDAHSSYRRFHEALPSTTLDQYGTAEATALLVERYVARYGPATLEDIAWWTGLGRHRCLDALNQLGDHVDWARVRGWEGEHVILRADLDRLAGGGRLARSQFSVLADLDPLTMGYRRRDRLLDADRRDLVYDRSGNATNVLLVDGRVAGVWDVLIERREVRFYILDGPPSPTEEQVRTELSAIGSFVTGLPVMVRRIDWMTPLTERRAGWVVRPLHDE
jgi:hypothetical protein